MIRNTYLASAAALAVALAHTGMSVAAVSAEEAKALGTTLTPWGAIQAGNKEGTIPAYTGPAKTPASFDPKNPGFKQWGPPCFSFSTGQLDQRVAYLNLTNRTVSDGPSYNTDEQGVVLSWFFPATASKLCFDGFGPY